MTVKCFRFKKEWLKNGYSDQSKVERDRKSGELSKNVAEALLGVHLHNSIPLADKPSDMDIQLLKDLYGNQPLNQYLAILFPRFLTAS